MSTNITVILGMHRSGTSLISASQFACGLNFGEELMGGNQYNLKGYWEDNDIVAFNNKVLQALGMTWDSLDFIDVEYWQSNKIKDLVTEGIDLITKKLLLSDNSFAFKDPRTIRVLPVWLKVFEYLGIKPNYIFIVRNPLDVSNSLNKRENKSYSLSQLIWLHHNIGHLNYLLNESDNLEIVDFYDFCKEPKQTLLRLLNEDATPALNERIDKFVDEFYDDKLVSQQTDPYQLSVNNTILPLAFNSYRVLRNLANNSTGSKVQLKELTLFWRKVGPTLCEQHKTLQIEANQSIVFLRNKHAQEVNSLKSDFNHKLEQSHKESLVLKTEVNSSKNLITHYKKIINNKNDRVEGLLNSLSWRLTAPLRWVLSLFV
jgi:hypothetical protein